MIRLRAPVGASKKAGKASSSRDKEVFPSVRLQQARQPSLELFEPSPVSTTYWKTSPSPGKDIRPSVRLQQARQPSLELFQLSPVPLRYDEADRSLFAPKARRTYSDQRPRRLLDAYPPEPNRALRAKPNFNSTAIRGPFCTFRLFSVAVLATAALHLIILGHRSFEGVHSHSGRTGKNVFLFDKASFFRSGHPDLQGPPRVFFSGEHPYGDSPSFRSTPGRQLVLYPAEISDATQLYGTKSSDDAAIAGSMERRFFPSHETNPDCVPMSGWQTKSFPTCNSLHEMGIVPSLSDSSLRLLSSSGSWRDAWRFKTHVAPSAQRPILDNVVIKTLKYQHLMQDRYFEFSRVDALAMERLTSSPYVMDVHGFCGVSVVTERGAGEITHLVKDLSPRNKVELATKMAKSIAAVHELDGQQNAVALVHNDINTSNWLTGRKNNPLLNDFNIAVLMMKDRRTNKSCSFPGHFPNPQWKSPEEQAGPGGASIGELNEKVDIYALGNILFRFATGKGLWREMAGKDAKFTNEQKKQIAYLKVSEGRMPMVPGRSELKDPYILLLVEAMEWCYRFKPEERPTAREVADFLGKSKEELDSEQAEFGRLPT